MSRVIPVLVLLVLMAAWGRFVYTRSAGRAYRPLWMAFSATALSLMFLISGAIGYTLSKHARFASGTAWADGVIWWEIWVGIAAALIASYLWHLGLRSIRDSD
jgi:drug/metabolite transporter (DMT)-like permease